VASEALGVGGASNYRLRAVTAANGNGYWQDELDADDAFFASVVSTDTYKEQKVYAAGCRINDDGDCSILVRAVKGTK
jgi:hypothetical protein